MVGFLCGMIVGSALTVILMCLISTNEDEKDLHNEVNLTVEDCSDLKTDRNE